MNAVQAQLDEEKHAHLIEVIEGVKAQLVEEAKARDEMAKLKKQAAETAVLLPKIAEVMQMMHGRQEEEAMPLLSSAVLELVDSQLKEQLQEREINSTCSTQIPIVEERPKQEEMITEKNEDTEMLQGQIASLMSLLQANLDGQSARHEPGSDIPPPSDRVAVTYDASSTANVQDFFAQVYSPPLAQSPPAPPTPTQLPPPPQRHPPSQLPAQSTSHNDVRAMPVRVADADEYHANDTPPRSPRDAVACHTFGEEASHDHPSSPPWVGPLDTFSEAPSLSRRGCHKDARAPRASPPRKRRENVAPSEERKADTYWPGYDSPVVLEDVPKDFRRLNLPQYVIDTDTGEMRRKGPDMPHKEPSSHVVRWEASLRSDEPSPPRKHFETLIRSPSPSVEPEPPLASENANEMGVRLLAAAKTGACYEMEYLIKAKADMHVVGPDDKCPIHVAAMFGQNASIVTLMQHKADVDVRNSYGRSALHLASQLGHHKMIKNLIKFGADANAVDMYIQTPLHWAARLGRGAAVNMLVECGAATEATEAIGLTPLHLAARYAQLETVEALLMKRANVNAVDEESRDPMSWAAIFGNWAVVEVLQNADGQQPWLAHPAEAHSR